MAPGPLPHARNPPLPQGGKVSHELLPALPRVRRACAGAWAGHGKVLLAGSDGFEGDAVVAAVALKMQALGCTCYQAVTQLLHSNAALLVGLGLGLRARLGKEASFSRAGLEADPPPGAAVAGFQHAAAGQAGARSMNEPGTPLLTENARRITFLPPLVRNSGQP